MSAKKEKKNAKFTPNHKDMIGYKTTITNNKH
jgi:hypothetical protein